VSRPCSTDLRWHCIQPACLATHDFDVFKLKFSNAKLCLIIGYSSRQGGNWHACVQVWAVAYDNPIPGYKTTTTSNLRLWDAEAIQEFDLGAFNAGDYDQVGIGSCSRSRCG
jgi:glucan phosphorylase